MITTLLILVKLVDSRRRREDEMAGLQGRISDAMLELREAARRLVEREMQSRGVRFEIEDRVMVDPRMFRQVA